MVFAPPVAMTTGWRWALRRAHGVEDHSGPGGVLLPIPMTSPQVAGIITARSDKLHIAHFLELPS